MECHNFDARLIMQIGRHVARSETLGGTFPPFVCPKHGTELAGQGGELICSERETYRADGGIPRFVDKANYTDAFGLQWTVYRTTQLDSVSGTTITRDRLRRCIGEELWANLEGRNVLECGCGAGRFTEILLDRGAYVTSVDLSSAVEANAANFPVSDRHRVAQADILALPFAPQQFDLVICLGVIQHTPDPEATIAALASHVRPGGWLVIDHYTYSLSWWTKTAPLFRAVLRRLPAEAGLRWTERLVNAFLPLHKATRNLYPAHVLVSRLSPVLCYYRAYPEIDDELQREWALLDTHDSLTDWYRHLRSRKAIRRALELAGLTAICCEKGGNGVEARAMRPLA
jgi:2-polyprenyl-3-methyl-5-hydroxy-6-metoxy-1,4-benzoquinol methylase